MAGRINKGRQKQEEMTDITMKPTILPLDGCLAARQPMKPLTPKKTPHQTPAKLRSIPPIGPTKKRKRMGELIEMRQLTI
jgi:hypothetical protein